MIAAIRTMITTAGMPQNFATPNWVKLGGICSVIVDPLPIICEMPSNTDPVPIVAINGSMPTRTTSRALNRPAAESTTRTTSTAAQIGNPPFVVWKSQVTLTTESVMIEPTDTSKTPEARGNNRPMATMASSAWFCAIPKRLLPVRKCEVRDENKTTRAIRIRTPPNRSKSEAPSRRLAKFCRGCHHACFVGCDSSTDGSRLGFSTVIAMHLLQNIFAANLDADQFAPYAAALEDNHARATGDEILKL